MANISTLTVSLVAETAKFTNGLKRARQDANRFSKIAGVAFKSAATGVTALTAAIAALTKRSLTLVDQQQKIATRLGLTQSALAGLTLAAQQTGNSQKNLELALQRSTRRIAEAAQGAGEAQGALRELGLDARALAQLSPDEQFIALSRAFEDVANQSDRVRLGFKLFDSEGVGLINTLRLGEDGLRDFIEQSERLGLSLERNQTKAIEDANDAAGLLKSAFTGLGNQIAARLAPSITAAANAITVIVSRVTEAIPKFSAWAASIFGVRRELANLSLADISEELKNVDKELGEAIGLWKEQNRALSAYRDEAGNVSPVANDLVANIKIQEDVIADLRKRWNDLIQQRIALKKTLEEPINDSLNLDFTGGTGRGSGSRPLSFEQRAPLAAKELRENLALFEEWERRANEAFNSTRTASEALQIKLQDIATQLRENPFFDEDLARRESRAAIDAYIAELERLEEKTDETGDVLNEFAQQAASNLQDNFAEFLFDPFEKGLDGMLKSFVNTLRKMVANLLAQKLLTSFFGSFPGLGQAFGFNPGTPTVPGRRIGGPVRAGQTVLGGEGSPELFTPGASGSIRPLGSVTIMQENNFGGGGNLDPATLIPILEENNRKLKGDILDEFDRGAFA